MRCANAVISISQNFAINLFNEVNSKLEGPYTEKYPAPETAVLQIAILRHLWKVSHDKNQPFLKRNWPFLYVN